jgi:hypothetical protein
VPGTCLGSERTCPTVHGQSTAGRSGLCPGKARNPIHHGFIAGSSRAPATIHHGFIATICDRGRSNAIPRQKFITDSSRPRDHIHHGLIAESSGTHSSRAHRGFIATICDRGRTNAPQAPKFITDSSRAHRMIFHRFWPKLGSSRIHRGFIADPGRHSSRIHRDDMR